METTLDINSLTIEQLTALRTQIDQLYGERYNAAIREVKVYRLPNGDQELSYAGTTYLATRLRNNRVLVYNTEPASPSYTKRTGCGTKRSSIAWGETESFREAAHLIRFNQLSK